MGRSFLHPVSILNRAGSAVGRGPWAVGLWTEWMGWRLSGVAFLVFFFLPIILDKHRPLLNVTKDRCWFAFFIFNVLFPSIRHMIAPVRIAFLVLAVVIRHIDTHDWDHTQHYQLIISWDMPAPRSRRYVLSQSQPSIKARLAVALLQTGGGRYASPVPFLQCSSFCTIDWAACRHTTDC